MKILIIKQLFYPEPTARSLDFALELTKQGHSVEVLTGFPSYPEGRIYKGYSQKITLIEKVRGIKVIRVPIFPDQSSRSIFRILNYLSFALSATFLGLWRVKKPDIVFAYHGALPVGIPAIVYRFFRRVPVVYDINDIWPDTLQATGMLTGKWGLKLVNVWCNVTYRLVSHITVLSEGFRDKLIERGVPAHKLSVVYHWSRDKALPTTEIVEPSKFAQNKFHFLYAGNVGKAQSLFSVVGAFESSAKEHPDIHLNILGDGVEKNDLIQFCKDRNIDNVTFWDRVSSEEVGKYLKSADVLLVHLKDEALFRITIPSKIIGYLFAQRPILLGLKGDAEKIITHANAGICCSPDDTADISRVLIEFKKMDKDAIKNMGLNARKYYDDNFTIEKNTQRYIEIFNTIVND